MENKPTSIYLPPDLKQQLVEVAKANGFEVRRGCKSDLPQFIGVMLRKYTPSTTDALTMPLLLQSLTPELRNVLIKLSKMDATQQQRASQVLELIFSTWSEQSVKEHYDNKSA